MLLLRSLGIASMTFEFDHVDLSDDKENQQIEFDDLLDDKDGKKEVIEHFDDKENQCFVELPIM
jgi:hypothetical protein